MRTGVGVGFAVIRTQDWGGLHWGNCMRKRENSEIRRNSVYPRLRMQFPHSKPPKPCAPMTGNPTPMPVLFPCHRHLTFGRQLCSNMGKSERNIYGSEFPRHQLHNRYTRTSLADNTNCGFTATPKQQDRESPTPGTRRKKCLESP